jgi:hypothetical protein
MKTSESQADGSVGLQIKRSGWESDFFGKEIGTVTYDRPYIAAVNPSDITRSLQALLRTHQTRFDLIQLNVGNDAFKLFSPAQTAGFKVVESRMTFGTEIDRSDWAPSQNDAFVCANAAERDLAEIIALAHAAFTDNPAFFSRYKNENYFSRENAEKYYEYCIRDAFSNSQAMLIVCKAGDEIAGFMSWLPMGNGHNLAFRAGLTAVNSDYKKRSVYTILTAFAVSQVGHAHFTLINTTHSNNVAMLQNYIKNRKTIQSTEHILYYDPNLS